MAQRFHSIDLQKTNFALLSEQQARTLILPVKGEGDVAPPGIAYCHNVLPTKQGMNSVGYLDKIPAFGALPVGETFTDVRIIFGDAQSRIHIAWDTAGNVYSLPPGTFVWIALPATVPATGGPGFDINSVTTGTVNGVTHIFYAGISSFTYNEITDELDSETLAGLAIADIISIAASSGYLTAFTTLAIAWSSTIDPTDFVPSAVTGAGGGNVAGTDGDIIFATSNTLGLLISTAGNTLAGTFTGNVQFPFKFREIENSEGGTTLDKVAHETNGSKQFIFSKAGMQTITSQRAELILPEVTDFLAGRRFEDYNETTDLYEITDLAPSATMLKKIKLISARYLVISYGISTFTHALVYDIGLQKLGKLRTTHVDCFEYIEDQTEVSKETIAFVAADGSVSLVNFSIAATSSGVLILGKLQLSHTKFLNLLGVVTENVQTGDVLTVTDQASIDGKTFTSEGSILRNSDENIREYAFRVQAKNHSLVFKGQFNFNTVLVRYGSSSRR